MTAALFFSSLCLVAGGMLLAVHVRSQRRPSLQVRMARAEGELSASALAGIVGDVPESMNVLSGHILAGYEERLRRAGRNETAKLLVIKKLLLAVAVPLVPLL